MIDGIRDISMSLRNTVTYRHCVACSKPFSASVSVTPIKDQEVSFHYGLGNTFASTTGPDSIFAGQHAVKNITNSIVIHDPYIS